jgi:hypothetical protein
VVTFVVRNDGAHPHNLTIGDERVAVDTGQVAILTTELGGPATPFVCTLHPKMTGEVRVRP